MKFDKDSKAYTLGVAAILCLVCSIFVAGAAVGLKPIQQAAKAEDVKRNILRTVGLWAPGVNIDEAFRQVEPRVISMETHEFVEGIDPLSYDMIKAAKTTGQNIPIPRAEDIASIGAKPKYAVVYLVRDEAGALRSIILPISGYGLWSTLYGFLALEPDANTVIGLNFYQHAETPGLGGEVDNPRWKALWAGKKVYDEQGQVALGLIKGTVAPDAPGAEFKVDALSGATLTGNGVTHALQYWMSDQGYRPFLQKLTGRG
jgi:Na+-transporting NADH:ubiquinone oxidoreductase subunit C